MLVKSEIKRIRSLQQKKYRNELGLFFVEGKKTVKELLDANVKPYKIYTVTAEAFDVSDAVTAVVSGAEFKQISQLKNPNGVLGVFYMPTAKAVDFSDWILALDDVRDPGNLGTIIRLCDWFGIKNLVCSKQTVDCYNPKVLQATMGSISRVNIQYVALDTFLEKATVNVYGAFMQGASVYSSQLPEKGVLVMGNEGNGISLEIEKLISQKISIPQYGSQTAESLNVATASAILLNELRRVG